ncbi:MAG TPA: hypothetical protein V6D18_15675 [Thermosynechococcaceae cyanobacterium]
MNFFFDFGMSSGQDFSIRRRQPNFFTLLSEALMYLVSVLFVVLAIITAIGHFWLLMAGCLAMAVVVWPNAPLSWPWRIGLTVMLAILM